MERCSTLTLSRVNQTREGSFWLGRKPVAKRMTRTLKRIKEELRRRMHAKVVHTTKWLGKSYRYLNRFVDRLKRLWLRTLRDRNGQGGGTATSERQSGFGIQSALLFWGD